MNKTRKLAECGILIALAFILSYIKIFDAPNGGSVTLASMLPIVIISFRHGTKWGVLSGFVYSILQMIQGFDPPPVQSFIMFALVVLLDYIIAFSVIGFAGSFNFIKNKAVAACIGTFSVIIIRGMCHIFSGIIIWADPTLSTGATISFSVAYNLGYLIPEAIITTVAAYFVFKIISKQKV